MLTHGREEGGDERVVRPYEDMRDSIGMQGSLTSA